MTRIYYIEDDINIATPVKDYLEQKSYHVTIFATIAEAKIALERSLPALVLLDWNMPDGDGGTFCEWLRSKWSQLPVIFITVRNDTADIVAGFGNGADDYLIKPFELEVLHSRILALLRRIGDLSTQCLMCDGITLDRSRMRVFCEGEEVILSSAEYQLLCILLENKGKTVTRERLLEQIWDCNGNYVNNNTLTVTMKRLREKLRQPACLKTIRSFGYRMEERS